MPRFNGFLLTDPAETALNYPEQPSSPSKKIRTSFRKADRRKTLHGSAGFFSGR